MGIDLTRLCNHHLHFKNETEFVTQFSKGFNSKVYPHYIFDEDLKKQNGIIYLDEIEGESVQDLIDKNDFFISMYLTNNFNKRGNDWMYTNSFCMSLNLQDFYVGRWADLMFMTKQLNENSFPNIDFYLQENDNYQFHKRKKYYDFVKTIGATESVIFCDDYHPEWLDMIEQNCTLNDFISWGKKEFIYVDFKDLPSFDFPENKPDYYNVFINDSFEDLKAFEK